MTYETIKTIFFLHSIRSLFKILYDLFLIPVEIFRKFFFSSFISAVTVAVLHESRDVQVWVSISHSSGQAQKRALETRQRVVMHDFSRSCRVKNFHFFSTPENIFLNFCIAHCCAWSKLALISMLGVTNWTSVVIYIRWNCWAFNSKRPRREAEAVVAEESGRNWFDVL